ncbi:MAG: DUF6763 family protein [Methylococcaceae bacterium]
MVGKSLPLINAWYRDPESMRTFQVVSVDADSDAIDIQYADGDLSELDFGSWKESAFILIQQADDWSASYGEMELDDLGYTDTDRHERNPDGFSLDDLDELPDFED